MFLAADELDDRLLHETQNSIDFFVNRAEFRIIPFSLIFVFVSLNVVMVFLQDSGAVQMKRSGVLLLIVQMVLYNSCGVYHIGYFGAGLKYIDQGIFGQMIDMILRIRFIIGINRLENGVVVIYQPAPLVPNGNCGSALTH